jgi:hypothetical protein
MQSLQNCHKQNGKKMWIRLLWAWLTHGLKINSTNHHGLHLAQFALATLASLLGLKPIGRAHGQQLRSGVISSVETWWTTHIHCVLNKTPPRTLAPFGPLSPEKNGSSRAAVPTRSPWAAVPVPASYAACECGGLAESERCVMGWGSAKSGAASRSAGPATSVRRRCGGLDRIISHSHIDGTCASSLLVHDCRWTWVLRC